MQAKAVARYVRIAPRKARQITNLIKGKDLKEALTILRYTPRGAAAVVEKVVRSAAANAENNHDMNVDALYVKNSYVDEGPTYKRWLPRARGRADRIRKRTSHITVILEERQN